MSYFCIYISKLYNSGEKKNREDPKSLFYCIVMLSFLSSYFFVSFNYVFFVVVVVVVLGFS
jgi:hypothetical protein